LRDDAASRPRFDGADFFDAAADFFEAACAPCGLKRKMAEMASAIRKGNRNFRVIEPSSLKNQAEAVAGARVSTEGSAGGGRV
jgi:hypothetical protein